MLARRALAPEPLVTIRQAGPADCRALSALGKRTFSEAFGYLFAEKALQEYLDEEYSETIFSQLFAEPRQRLFVLSEEEDLIGYVGIRENVPHPFIDAASSWQLQKLYLLQSHVGQGLGVRLLAHALDYCRTYAPLSLWLEVAEVNPRGKAFYLQQGFRPAGEETKRFCGDPFTVTIMRYDL